MSKYKHLTTNGLSLQTVWEWAKRLIEDLNSRDDSVVPAGTVAMSASATPPQGWLLCDGASYAVNDYRLLFTAIGYTYGGSAANFLVPDYSPSPISGVIFIIKA